MPRKWTFQRFETEQEFREEIATRICGRFLVDGKFVRMLGSQQTDTMLEAFNGVEKEAVKRESAALEAPQDSQPQDEAQAKTAEGSPRAAAPMTIPEVAAIAAAKRPDGWRRGQAVFNALCQLYPDATELLRGGPLDCFYDDSQTDAFIAEVARCEDERRNR